MTKKNFNARITSAEQARELSDNLKSIISYESWLTQKVLIYVAELLEEQNALLALSAHRLPPNKHVHGLCTRVSKWLGTINNR